MSLSKITLLAMLGIGLAGCVAEPPTQSPSVVQDSGIGATGQSMQGGAAAPPPGTGNLATHVY